MAAYQKHGMKGDGKKDNIRHSDKYDPLHSHFDGKKIPYKQGVLVKIPDAHEGPKPVFVEKGSLQVPGDLCWMGESLENVPGYVMTERLEKFKAEVALAGGAHRINKVVVKDVYYSPSKVEVLKRRTVAVPPWCSYACANYPAEKKADLIKKIVKIVSVLARNRWPDADLKAFSVHDDTSNLHIDIWGTELEKKQHTQKGKTKDIYVSKGLVFPSGLVGPGITYLQMKKEVGHSFHKIDQATLARGLEQYREHVSATKKPLPLEPVEISFHRELDEKLAGIWVSPAYSQKRKDLYLEHCKRLDFWKYKLHDELSEVKEKESTLADIEIQLQTKASDLKVKETNLVNSYKQKFDDLAKREEEVDEILETIDVNQEPYREFLIDRLKNDPINFRRIIINAPRRSNKLVERLKPFKDPEVQELRKSILGFLNTGIEK